jgi:hypothetical protein
MLVLMRSASRRSAHADRSAFRAGREKAGGSSIKVTFHTSAGNFS